MRVGVPTLPVLMLRKKNDPADAKLLALIDGDLTDDATLAEALRQLRAHPIMDEAKAEVERHAALARETLAPLPDGDAKLALFEVCDELVRREH